MVDSNDRPGDNGALRRRDDAPRLSVGAFAGLSRRPRLLSDHPDAPVHRAFRCRAQRGVIYNVPVYSLGLQANAFLNARLNEPKLRKPTL